MLNGRLPLRAAGLRTITETWPRAAEAFGRHKTGLMRSERPTLI
jgi:hypothetical protein